MPSINMIAARRAEKKMREKLIRIGVLVIVCEVALVLGMLGFMTARMHSASRFSDQLDRKLSSIQPTVDTIQMYESEIKALEPRLNLLADSKERTMLWHSVLLNLSRSMPEKTWLNSLTTNSTTASQQAMARTTLSLSGTSVSQGLVGEAMLRLNEFPEFERVDLNYTQKGGSDKFESVQFQIAARLKSNEPQKGEASNNVQN